jgi:hypothetical protein
MRNISLWSVWLENSFSFSVKRTFFRNILKYTKKYSYAYSFTIFFPGIVIRLLIYLYSDSGHKAAQWLRHYAASRNVVDSVPMRSLNFFNFPIPSSRTSPWGLLSLWQKWVPRDVSRGVKRGRLVKLTIQPPSVCRLSRQCGILNISQTHGPLRPVETGYLHFFYMFRITGFLDIVHRPKF